MERRRHKKFRDKAERRGKTVYRGVKLDEGKMKGVRIEIS
jgi:hypothetical protein